MRQRKKLLAVLLALALTCGIAAVATGAATPNSRANAPSNEGIVTSREGLIFPLGMEVPFNGKGYLAPMIANEEVYNFPQTNNVTFEPGARSDWYTHGGMVIMVTGGVGYYQVIWSALTADERKPTPRFTDRGVGFSMLLDFLDIRVYNQNIKLDNRESEG